MGIIKHDILPKQRTRKNNNSVEIDLFPLAQELFDELENIGIIDRVKSVPQLGLIRVPKKLSKTRYDYIMLQLYLHQIIKNTLKDSLKYTYGSRVYQEDFRKDYKYNGTMPTTADILQLLTIVYNIGHFYNTFTASRAAIIFANETESFKDKIINASLDPRYVAAAIKIIDEKDYHHFHLLNSALILEKCDTSKSSVSLSLEILYAYLNQSNLSQSLEENKLPYIFSIFKTVRNVSYMAYDLQIANTPFTMDICNESSMKMLFQELLSEYNDNRSSNQLVHSISKLLDDSVYNENSNAICYYRISRKMVIRLKKSDSIESINYYPDMFINQESILNTNYPQIRDFIQEQILKLTFSRDDKFLSENLLDELERINNTRVGYYDRHAGEKTLLVSIGKNCDYDAKVHAAFKVMKCVTNYLRRIPGVTSYDVRYLLAVKFFLYYLMRENPVLIKPTVDKEKCVVCTRGKNARIKEVNGLLKRSAANSDQKHEVEFLRSRLEKDTINDTSICIPASIIVYRKGTLGVKLCEFDGMIIHPMRKQNQIVFLEAKNTTYKPSLGITCLSEKFDKLKINYKVDSIQKDKHDAFMYYSI